MNKFDMNKFAAKYVDMQIILVALFCVTVLWACQVFAADGLTPAPASTQTAVQPGDDFFDYVNGAWLNSVDIPAGHDSWGTRDVTIAQTNQRVLDLIAAIPDGKSASVEQRKVADFYRAFMDEASIEAAGTKPLAPLLKSIAALSGKGALSTMLGATVRTNIEWTGTANFDAENLFGLWIAQGFDDPTQNVAYLLQGGLGLPDRSYYDSSDEHMISLREKYLQHIASVFNLIGFKDAQQRAQRVFNLESMIAATHASREDSDNEWKAHNTWSKHDFIVNAPGLDWNAFFKSAGLADQKSITVWHPGAITGCAKLVNDVDLAVWKDFLALHLADQMSPVLPVRFREEHFNFFDHAIKGQESMPARSQMALDALNDAMPDAVGRLYVSHYFPAADKSRIEAMVVRIKAAFNEHIDNLQWMSANTKTEAKAKLKSLYIGIGYPEHWASIDGLTVSSGDAFGNALRAGRFHTKYEIAKLARPVDHQEWTLPAHVMLALNLGMQNQLNFSAAFLQAPYYDPAASDASNYGSIGVVIGHEINHMFDELGNRFDSAGRLRYWWTPAEIAHYHEFVAPIVQQYSGYTPLPGLNLNGEQTYQENTADLVGLNVAFNAWRSTASNDATVLAGDQQFFIGYAKRGQVKLSDSALRKQVVGDAHAPSKYRIYSVRNLDAWYTAFNVLPGQALYLGPDQRVNFR